MIIPAGEFKAKCLKIMEYVKKTGKEVTITKYKKPVAKLVPVKKGKKKDEFPAFGIAKGEIEILGDIIAPIDVEWEVEKD